MNGYLDNLELNQIKKYKAVLISNYKVSNLVLDTSKKLNIKVLKEFFHQIIIK